MLCAQRSKSRIGILTGAVPHELPPKGPFLPHVPTRMEDMRRLPALSYQNVEEELAEKFHESRDLLRAMNPHAAFRAGETIVVPNVLDESLPEAVSRIVVDKARQTVEAFAQDGKLIGFYPSTVGSTEKPAPDGTLTITSVRRNPFYHYNPAYHFKGVHTEHPFTIKPGPNNPVGLIWIALSEKGYGIHGTPDPKKIGKSASHGCVRLTNWDALQLGGAVRKGVKVEFLGDEAVARARRHP